MKIKKLIKNILRFLLRILFYFFRPIVRIFLRPLYKYPKVWKLFFDIKQDILSIIGEKSEIKDVQKSNDLTVEDLFTILFPEIKQF